MYADKDNDVAHGGETRITRHLAKIEFASRLRPLSRVKRARNAARQTRFTGVEPELTIVVSGA